MKAFSCPQCSGSIKNIGSHQTIAECDYCGAQVSLDEPNFFDFAARNFRAIAPSVRRPSVPTQPIFIAITVIGIVFFITFLASFLPTKPRSAAQIAPEPSKSLNYPAYSQTPDKSDENVALAFGGKGGSAGLFENANVAVGKNGDIYVADKTMRVQRFNQGGKYLNAWIVKGEKSETIDKIAASANGEVCVLIGGKIVVYKGETGKQLRVLSDSRKHYIHDFVMRDGGEMTYVADGETGEEFVQTKGKEIVNRFAAIHSRAAEAKIPTAGIKIAVGG